MRALRPFGALALAVTLVGCSRSATPPAPPSPQPGVAQPEPGQARPPSRAPGGNAQQGGQRPGGQRQGEGEPRPYASVITAGATTREGLFKTHVIGTKLYFEIPANELGRELLVVTRAARVPVNMGYGGQQIAPSQVVKWVRIGHRVVLRSVSYETVADSTSPIYQAVRNSNNDVVIAAFDVEAYGPDSAAVVDVTRLYTQPPRELGPGNRFRTQPDQNRSFVERVLAFPTNVEVEATVTYPPPPSSGSQSAPSNPFAPSITETASLVMHWSMVKLPENPMMPRLADRRIGFFSIRQLDYGRPEQRAEERRYVVRWRLEKKDPNAAISEPVKPIEYYVDPATPDWLKPWVRSGIEAWQPAFEAAGFRRAIVAKDPPTPEEDPDWSPEDARYSVVRWFPSTIENAQGPHVRDPRTGEILESDIYMYHNIMNLQRSWYFTQVGHLDPRASMWPFPDTLMGKLVEFVVAHEVGHTLGYQHDQKGSSTYPVDSVRSRTWVRRMGHSPSIMDYSRFNYTAQPEDSIDLEDLIPRIGPWDIYTTRWGYTPIPGAQTPDAEWATLDRWSRQQDTVPWYRFSMSDSRGADPGDHSEAVGDDDPVRATAWGIRSIKQIVPLLVPATVHDGANYDDLDEMYSRLIQQWRRELSHVAVIVGGAEAQEKYAGQDGVRYRPWPRTRQREAVRFLSENAFATPSFFLVDDILRRIEVEGALSRINAAQTGVLNTVLNDRRLERLIEFEALAENRAQAYGLGEMLADVRDGIWGELASARVTIDPFRRELQRSYLAAVRRKLNPPEPRPGGGGGGGFGQQASPARATSDVRAAFRSELRALDRQIAQALSKAGDRMTRAHLEDGRDQIREMLEPDRQRAAN